MVHCLAGRGRTGTVITSYLLFAGLCPTITDALVFYAHQRSVTRQGVSQPSQRRSVYYLDAVLRHNVYPKPKSLRLLRLILGPAPRMSSRGGWRPLIYLYHYSNCAEEQLFISESSKEKAVFIPENHYCVYDLSKANIEMVGDIVLKVSHIGGLIQTKYEEIIRLIFHTGLETSRQWNGGWPFEAENNPKQSPATSPRRTVDDENDTMKYPKPPDASQDSFLPENYIPSEPPNHESYYPDAPNENFPESVFVSTYPNTISMKTVEISKLRTDFAPQVNNSYLKFFKPDLDNAYKMEDAKFPSDFCITFECVEMESDSVIPENIWNEELYRNFLNKHVENKKNQEIRPLKADQEDQVI